MPVENARRGRARRRPRGARRARPDRHLVALLRGDWRPGRPPAPRRRARPRPTGGPDLADVRGQADAKRALEIAAAGGHNLLMVGPPGSGQDDARAAPAGHPAAADLRRGGRDHAGPQRRRPRRRGARSPSGRSARRTTRSRRRGWSAAASTPRPGEITLAHRGVLFLDELAEFSRVGARGAAPAARGRAASRSCAASARSRFPAAAMLVGRLQRVPVRAHRAGECTCNEIDRARYHRRLSGPLLDRIDLVCVLEPRAPLELGRRTGPGAGELGGGPRAGGRRARAPASPGSADAGRDCNAEMDARLTRDARAARRAARARSRWTPTPARARSAAAGTTGCCAWRARSPTSTARDRVARERRRRGARATGSAHAARRWRHERLRAPA